MVKAYPPIYVSEATLNFNAGNFSWFGFTPPATTLNLSAFWDAVTLYHSFTKTVVDNGGTAYSYISQIGNRTFSFSTTIEMPGMTDVEAFDFLQPLYNGTQALGILVNQTLPSKSLSWGASRQGVGDIPGGSKFASRLFPYSNWEDETKFNTTMAAIRSIVEAGYTFHGVSIKPDEATAGYPGNSAVNPAFRRTIMHADIFDLTLLTGMTPQFRQAAEAKLNAAMNVLREATPDGGSYINESDVEEPDWQKSFFGDKYAKLLEIKRRRDPWGLFYAPKTVGTDSWEVRTADGLPTQNGKLCRVGSA